MTTVDNGQPDPSETSDQSQYHTEITVEQGANVFLGPPADSSRRSFDGLVENLPTLPPNVHPFRDPRHDEWRAVLERDRILLLSSYQEIAAYAAAYSLVQDDQFSGKAQKAFLPARGRDKERADLDLNVLSEEQFLGQQSQVLLIEIDRHCPLLDSALGDVGLITVGLIRDTLKRHRSHVILIVKQDLLSNRSPTSNIASYTVSHIRYLLENHVPAVRAEELERRVLAAVAFDPGSMEMRELHQLVAEHLGAGVESFESFLAELEQTHALPNRQGNLQTVTPEQVFPDDSDMHRAATFVATYFPDVGQREFGRLVLTLLADQITTVERSRQIIAPQSTVTSVREQVQERWTDRWIRDADRVFRECRLRPVVSPTGGWLVDFDEPYLRRELRAFFERHHPFYLDRQCQILQARGVLFAIDLSAAAVESLVRLFVERAVIDPPGFGSVWLLDLVQGLRIQMSGTPPGDSQEEVLAWLLEQVAVEAQFRAHFYGRLALLIREMLDREPLRRMVRDFFEYLIAARQHDALLGVVLDLARRLRFAPHFDPLFWMRRLLDQGSAVVRVRTQTRLIALARDSGPRIYEYLAVIRTWLPDASRTPDRFSTSNRVALAFPFGYCLAVAAMLPEDHYGRWPSHHPLFYALPADPAEARKEIGRLVGWILDPRGAALEIVDEADPPLTAETRYIAYVGDLIEHWAWVLEGAMNEGHSEGRALFRVIAEEINQRLGTNERTWLQQSWQRRQENYVTHATSTQGPQRTLLINRRARLEQLRRRFAQMPQTAP
jgi:hypothetical protein